MERRDLCFAIMLSPASDRMLADFLGLYSCDSTKGQVQLGRLALTCSATSIIMDEASYYFELYFDSFPDWEPPTLSEYPLDFIIDDDGHWHCLEDSPF